MLKILETKDTASRERRLRVHESLLKFGLSVFVESEESGPTTRTYVIRPGATSVRKIRSHLEDIAVALGVSAAHLAGMSP